MKINKLSRLAFPKFIKLNFGEEGYKKWLLSISPEAREIYTNKKVNDWYDLENIFLDPLQKLCDLFYDGDFFGAEELGKFDVESSINRILKFFVKLGSPEFVIKKTSAIFGKYYKGVSAEIINLEKNKTRVRVHNFENMKKINEHLLIGWMIRALEISGAKNIKINTEQKNINNKNVIDFFGTWE